MKRALAALASFGVTMLLAAPAGAATQSGAVKMTWSVAPYVQLALVTDYTPAATPAQGTASNTLLPNTAGICTSGSSETAFNLTFGAVASSTAATSCDYENAIAASIVTNSSNWQVTEYLDQAAPAGVSFCALVNGTTTGTGKTPAWGQATNGAAVNCNGAGVALPAGTGAAGSNPGNPGTAGLRTATAPGSPAAFCNGTAAAPAATPAVCGEDIQINLAANTATATNQSGFVIIQAVAN